MTVCLALAGWVGVGDGVVHRIQPRRDNSGASAQSFVAGRRVNTKPEEPSRPQAADCSLDMRVKMHGVDRQPKGREVEAEDEVEVEVEVPKKAKVTSLSDLVQRYPASQD